MPITRGSTPATALADEAAERLRAELARLLLAREHERGGAVVEPGRVPGRDRAVLPERGLQRREPLGGRVRARVLVPREVADRHELVVEAPGLGGGGPAPLRARGERVLVLARDVPALGHVLAGLAHRLERELLLQPRVGEAPAERRVVDGAIAARERRVRLGHHERRAAHGLDAARDEEVAVAGGDRVRRADDGGEAGGAEAVHASRPRPSPAAPRAARPCAPRCGCPRRPGSRSRGRRPRSAPGRRPRARPPPRSPSPRGRPAAPTRARRRTGRRASGPRR